MTPQRDQVALQSRGFFAEFQVQINLVEISANAMQELARGDRRQVILTQAEIPVNEVLHAISLGQKLSAVENVDVDFRRGGLIAADEMTGQADPCDVQAQPPRDQNINQAEVNGVARATVHYAAQIAVFRIVVILVVAGEAQLQEKVLVDRGQQLLRFAARVKPQPQIAGITIQQSLVTFDVYVWIAALRQKPGALFQFQVFALPQTESQEAGIGGLSFEVLDDLLNPTPQGGLAA